MGKLQGDKAAEVNATRLGWAAGTFLASVRLNRLCGLQEWPQDALEAVARKFLNDMSLQKPVQTKLVSLCHAIHCKVSSAVWALAALLENEQGASQLLHSLPSGVQ